MADALTALNGDVTVAYLDEATRQKRIYWTGTSQRYSINALYSALMDHFDEPARMDNPSPMSAQTPVEYTTGIIDTGDDEPWYISYELMEHLYGGALKTSGWTRDLPGDGSGAVGLVVAPVTAASNNIVKADEGYTITHADGDAGTLLEVIDTGGTNDYLVIRPDDNLLANDFNSTSGNLTCNAHTAPQNAAAVTGEQVWPNLYSIGTIESNTHIYLYQGAVDGAVRTRIFSQNSATQDYWPNGHIDICVPIRDYTTTDSPIIDAGYITAFARKGTTEYASFEASTSTTSGGRNPVPLGTKPDLNNTTGTGNFVFNNASTDTLIDLEKLYIIGTTTSGNLAAGIQDDGGSFTDDTTDLNDVGGGGDVDVFPSGGEAVDDAFYFGMEELWNYLVVDISTQGVSSSAATTWEYYDGTTWSSLTMTDDSDSGNGAFTDGTGRYVISWVIPSDWTQTTVTNQPATLNKVYYVRVRISAANYTTLPILETAWAGGERQFKAIVRDSSITGASASSGNTDYFLAGEPQLDFSDDDVVLAGTSRKTMDVNGAPTAQGPALQTWFSQSVYPSISFGNTQYDIDDDGTDEYYGITIDCNSNPLTEVYEWLKYITRNGETSTSNTDGIEGEQYIGGTAVLSYTVADAGDLSEGDFVTQETSGATGIIVSMDENDSTKWILLRDTRGTFATGATDHTLTNDSTGSIEINSSATNFAANTVSPFGSFAGGKFFGARGVLLSEWDSNDENAFQLTPIEGGTKARPIAIVLTVSNLIGTDESTTTDDRVAIFRLTGDGGQIDKEEYSAAGGESVGGTSLVVDTAITQDTPGKSTGGVLRIRDNSNNNKEYRIRYASWDTSTFTLANVTPSNLTGSTNSTTIVSSTDELDGLKRGDLVLNETRGDATSYVISVDTATNTVTIDPPIENQASSDTISFNTLPIDVNTADYVYVPLLDKYATGTTASASIVYSSPIYFRVVARNSANTPKIIPFTANDSTSGTDRPNSVVRNIDTVIT